jgi:hypothetical protein
MIAVPGDTSAETISAIIADEAAIGVINGKTTAVRIIPAEGKKVGDIVASLAANEGQREEAVGLLHEAMSCGDLPYAFQPQFPWFKSLHGYPPYEELLRERERRLEQVRAELEQLE